MKYNYKKILIFVKQLILEKYRTVYVQILIIVCAITLAVSLMSGSVDCNKYKYICERHSIHDIKDGCITKVYYYSDECYLNNTECFSLKFKSCNKCGIYSFMCISMNSKCTYEGKELCYHYSEITKETSVNIVCFPKTLENDCISSVGKYMVFLLCIGVIIINILGWLIYIMINIYQYRDLFINIVNISDKEIYDRL
jgi:hypothetical protein